MAAYTQREFDRQLLIRLKEDILDYDILIDDRRRELDDAVERLREVVFRRDDLVRQLAALLARHETAA